MKSVGKDGGHVYRDSVELHRGEYYVTYHPAQLARPLALLNVVYQQGDCPDSNALKATMELELEMWLKRYPVPTMVMAFAGDDNLHAVDAESYLRGYANNGQLVREWRRFKQGDDLTYLKADELAQVYHDVPFRIPADVRKRAYEGAVRRGRSVRLIVAVMVGGPLLIELVALGWTWLGHVLAAIGLVAGFIKLARAMGWMKPSAKQVAEEKELQLMRHHHYHCLKNPEAFEGLKLANFKKQIAEDERATFDRIKNAAASKAP